MVLAKQSAGPSSSWSAATLALGGTGIVQFGSHDNVGNAKSTGTPAITLNPGGTLNSGGKFNTIWNLSLNGGTLTANGGDANWGALALAGTVTVGGSSASTTNVGASSTNARISVRNSGTTFDVADATLDTTADLTVSTVIGNGTAGDLNWGAGKLIKSGSGTMVLTATNTYTGDTTVNGGTLTLRKPYLADASSISIALTGKLTLDFDESLGDVSDTVATLTINGAAMAPGTWGATGSGATHIDNAHFAGVGTLTVTTGPTLTDYDNWVAPFFPGVTDPLIIGDAADPDGDGVTNHAEYAFGLVPNSGTSVNPITVPLDKITGTFTYTRRDPALTSLAYTVWTSTNLAAWTEDPGALQAAGPPAANGVQAVVVTLTTPPPTRACFIQVRAN